MRFNIFHHFCAILASNKGLMTQILKQAAAAPIQANAQATVIIPTTGTVYGLFFELLNGAGNDLTVAQMKAALGDIIVYNNGEQIMIGTATFWLDLQKYYADAYTGGAANVAGIIPIFVAPMHFNNFKERQVFGIGTMNITSFTVTLNVVSTASLNQINVYAEVSTEQRTRQQYISVRRFAQTQAAAAVQEIATLPLDGATYGRKHIMIELGTNPGVLGYVQCKVNGNIVFDTVDEALLLVISQVGRRSPQAAYYHIDFGRNNSLNDYLPMATVQDFRLEEDWTTAPTSYNIYIETICGLLLKSATTGKASAQ